MIKIKELFPAGHSLADEYLSKFEYPWEALSGIGEMIISLGKKLPTDEYNMISVNVWIHKTAVIAPTAFIGAPCIIGAGTEVRHCAFIRGSALVGKNCVIGNSVELKNVIIFDNVQAPHYNYAGDSILGYRSHMGAGSITSNIKSDRKNIIIKKGEEKIETGLRKIGAFLGEYVEVGCNSVLNPGTIIGCNSNIYPLSSVRGVIPENSIFKSPDNIIIKN